MNAQGDYLWIKHCYGNCFVIRILVAIIKSSSEYVHISRLYVNEIGVDIFMLNVLIL